MHRVLLTDDEANLRKLLTLVLRAAGFEVLEAATGQQALILAETEAFDVLVTDMVMDDMDGLTLAGRMAEKHSRLPVVFISGYAIDVEDAQQRHPHSTFLRKPFPPKELVTAIQEVMQGHAQEGK